MLLLLQGRLHRAALPRPRGCAEVTTLLGGWDGVPLPELPKIPIPELHEQNNPAEHAVLGTPLHPAAPRGAVCNPLHPHPPVPAATPGDKTQWEASPGVPESLLQDFSIVGNPIHTSWKSLVRTVCGPNFPGPGAERGAGCAAQPRRWTSRRHSPPRSPEHPCAAVNWIFSSRRIYIRLPLQIYTPPPLWPQWGVGAFLHRGQRWEISAQRSPCPAAPGSA